MTRNLRLAQERLAKIVTWSGWLVILIPVMQVAKAQVALPGPGTINTIAGTGLAGFNGDNQPATAATLNRPYGLVADTAGNIYIADLSNSRIRKVTASSGVISTVAGNGTAGFADGPVASSELNEPTSIALDSSGNIYIADYANNRLRVVNTTQNQITVAGVNIPPGYMQTVAGNGQQAESGDNGPASSAELSGPSGVAVDRAGNIYVADSGGGRVRAINAGTQTVTIATIQIPAGYINTIAGGGTRCSGGTLSETAAQRLNHR